MKRADDPTVDYTALVQRGYDACSPAFNAARVAESDDALRPLIDRLTAGSRVLDLGCGAGVPIARALGRTCSVTGVDLSYEQIALARRQVPEAAFMLGDMATCQFAAAAFDAIVSFYAIFHLPRERHEQLFTNIHTWLKPDGCLLASLAATDDGAYTEEFFGAEMYWSNYAIGEYEAMLGRCGFEIIAQERLTHGYGDGDHPPESHPLLFARRV